MRTARTWLTRTVVFALGAVAWISTPAYAQVDLYSLEAAYIYNFTEFTEWPAPRPGGGALIVCANPHNALWAMLAKLEGRTVSGKTWSVKATPEGSGVAACDVLIVDDAATSAAIKAAPARDLPILVIRPADADTGDGPGIVTLFREGDRLRFDIDNTEAVRRRLALSSKLLRLARNVT
jgi:hypothetical protein